MPAAIDSNLLWVYLDADPEITRRVHSIDSIWVPLPVVAEAWYAAINSARRADNIDRLQTFLKECVQPPLTEMTALLYAQVRFQLKQIGRPIQMNDIWIAAVCLEHNLPLATRDSDFDHVEGLTVLRW